MNKKLVSLKELIYLVFPTSLNTFSQDLTKLFKPIISVKSEYALLDKIKVYN